MESNASSLQKKIGELLEERQSVIEKVKSFRRRDYKSAEEGFAVYTGYNHRMEEIRLEVKELQKELKQLEEEAEQREAA